MPQLLAARARQEPSRTALETYGVASLSFGEWDRRASTVAAGLLARGLRRGDRVVLRFDNRDWTGFAVAYCAVQRAGGVAVPCLSGMGSHAFRYVLEHCAPIALLHGGGDPRLPAGLDLPTPTLAEIEAAPVDDRPGVETRPGDLAQIMYTSGTTGRPKAVGASHANLTFGAATDPRRRRLAHSERFLHAFPIGTNAGQVMLFNALDAHPSALTLPRFTPARFARLLDGCGVGSLFLVPAMAIELLRAGVLDRCDTSRIRLVGSTAAALPPAVANELVSAFTNAVLVNYYTSTEASPAQISMIFDASRPTALGRAAGGQVMIVDSHGAAVPAGTVGEVWLRSPHPRSYLGDEAASRRTFRDGWVRTGDVGRLDGDGYLYLVDRHQDVIKCGAHKVSTLEVEAALHEHPEVLETAVVGVPHPVLGASVAAVIVPRRADGATRLDLAAVRAFLSGRLADHELPSRVALADRLPRNAGGKVVKSELLATVLRPVATKGAR
ncbi:class I adenylate-forming enzyme family protein [Plantactinospora sp. WMMB782]|uniref:class I adenylate-forming enzyme family protein n=1 Tax=Plantactinospora sp. WMMB782 TaxID=3404121 RepID=UPI003B952C14